MLPSSLHRRRTYVARFSSRLTRLQSLYNIASSSTRFIFLLSLFYPAEIRRPTLPPHNRFMPIDIRDIGKQERKLLQTGNALRINHLVYTEARTCDIERWQTKPPSTMAERCQRAWFLKTYWQPRDELSNPSFHYWSHNLQPFQCLREPWTEEQNKEYEASCAELDRIQQGQKRNAGRRRWRDRSARKPQRNARRNWRKLRAYVRERFFTKEAEADKAAASQNLHEIRVAL